MLDIRPNLADQLIFWVTLGLVSAFWMLWAMYLMVHAWRRKTQPVTGVGGVFVKSKADRPLWITVLVVSSTCWIFGTLFTTGIMQTERNSVDYLPAIMTYVVQYGFGAILWLLATVDRMLSRYAMIIFTGASKGARRAKSRLFRTGCLGIPAIAFMMIGGLAISMNAVQVNMFGVTDQRDDFEVVLVTYLGVLLVGTLWLAILTRKIIGAHHELIRLLAFCATTFAALGSDATTTLWHALQIELVAQRCLLGIVVAVVSLNLVWTFALALRPRKRRTDIEVGNLKDTEVVRKMIGDTETTNQILDTQSIGSESDPNLLALRRPDDLLVTRKPRRRFASPLTPLKLEDWLSKQPPEYAKDRLDYNFGYFEAAQVEATMPPISIKEGQVGRILRFAQENLGRVKNA